MALFNSIWDDLKYSLRTGNTVTVLVVLNFTVWVVAKLMYLLLKLTPLNYGEAFLYFCIPADPITLLWRPWTVLTHMFLHDDFWHLISNLFGLYIFGSIVSDLAGNRRVLPIYLLGGLMGAATFVISAQFLPYVGSFAVGASAAVMALGGTAVVLAPDYRVPLLLLGEVKVKYIVLVLLLLDLIGVADKYNSGGHAAHIGGFLFGCLFVVQMRRGRDLALPVNRLFDSIGQLFQRDSTRRNRRKRKPQMAVKGTFGAGKGISEQEQLSFQEKLDLILDKIKAQGYQNLTPEEKEFLHNASKK